MMESEGMKDLIACQTRISAIVDDQLSMQAIIFQN